VRHLPGIVYYKFVVTVTGKDNLCSIEWRFVRPTRLRELFDRSGGCFVKQSLVLPNEWGYDGNRRGKLEEGMRRVKKVYCFKWKKGGIRNRYALIGPP